MTNIEAKKNAGELQRAAERLRNDFDRAFATAPPTTSERYEDFLGIRIAGDDYAIRLTEVLGLYRDRKIVPIPSGAAHLLGVASFRGFTAPVYDIRALLGHTDSSAPRWLLLACAESPVGFAFDVLEKHLRVATVNAVAIDPHARRHVQGVVRSGETILSLINLASILETIKHGQSGTKGVT